MAAEIVAGNPVAAADGLTVEILMGDVEVDPENASHVLGDLNWSRNNKGIVVLPESFEPHRLNPVAESLVENVNSFPGLSLT